jgi:ATP-dependent Lon protease
VGGEVLDIEVAVLPGRGRVHLTGALGDVMKESAGAALSYTRSRAATLGLADDFHKTRDIHVHVPAGATPKDGPSAGIAIAVALISALTGVPASGQVALTGEITLRGNVLPIGGLKEKAVAALRAGKTCVVMPAANARELEEIPEEVVAQLSFVTVRSMDEVLDRALVGRPSSHTAPPQRGAATSPTARSTRSADVVPATAGTARDGAAVHATQRPLRPLDAVPPATGTARRPANARQRRIRR